MSSVDSVSSSRNGASATRDETSSTSKSSTNSDRAFEERNGARATNSSTLTLLFFSFTVSSIVLGGTIGATSINSDISKSSFSITFSTLILLLSSEPNKSLILIDSISERSESLLISGIEAPLSQLETAWKLTPSLSASSIWVIFFAFLPSLILFATFIVSNINTPLYLSRALWKGILSLCYLVE